MNLRIHLVQLLKKIFSPTSEILLYESHLKRSHHLKEQLLTDSIFGGFEFCSMGCLLRDCLVSLPGD